MRSELHTVLVIEDNDIFAQMLADFLPIFWAEFPHPNRLKVAIASTLEQGFLLLKEQRIDLIILDLRLPGFDNIQAVDALVNHLRMEGRLIPVIVLSAYVAEETSREALSCGALECVSKYGGDLLMRITHAMENAWARHVYIERLTEIVRTGAL